MEQERIETAEIPSDWYTRALPCLGVLFALCYGPGSLGGDVYFGRLSQRVGSVPSGVVDAPQSANIVVVLRATPPNHVLE
ncbi:hypothetical protein PENSUB_13721 [Penicillium subrubescens]|uniref:Uncharacterized protein n=1 Tax=Penicillium subrubescens TaxID=1316194 RepID=A0A1Q5SP51_9EURO|nr:hypothetical protein PENSUB_13721 [Penicillium subrubescens]